MDKNSTLIFQLSAAGQSIPIRNAKITVYGNSGEVIGTMNTNSSGKAGEFMLTAPAKDLSQSPYPESPPYSTYNAAIEASGYLPVEINGIQQFDGTQTIQKLDMIPTPRSTLGGTSQVINVPPPAILTQKEKDPDSIPKTDPRILNEVYIPSYVVVHLGTPDNNSVANQTVSFQDYIKNVASSEIYPTWPDAAIRSNIYAQISFVLNRIYTEWYPSRGYSFNITNSTAYDQYYVPGRNIYDNISKIVDEIFNEYVKKQNQENPYFTQYCNGTTVTCEGLSQWGTVPLAENGYTPINILRRFYGNDIEVVETNDIRNIESSYPGTTLSLGSNNSNVRTIENQLNRIRMNYPAIPLITSVDNSYTSETVEAVKAFQRIFNLTQSGSVNKATWNKISYIYVAIKRLAELNGEGEAETIPPTSPSSIIKNGSTGSTVQLAQYFLAVISDFYPNVRPVSIDGIFGTGTENTVKDYQQYVGLTADGIIGPNTWEYMYESFLGIADTSGLVVGYPGTLLKVGSRGDNVWLMQSYLNTIAKYYPLPAVGVDGIFGNQTKSAVTAFQQYFGLSADGIIGPSTWDRIIAVRLLTN